MPAYGPKLLIW